MTVSEISIKTEDPVISLKSWELFLLKQVKNLQLIYQNIQVENWKSMLMLLPKPQVETLKHLYEHCLK